MMKTKFTVALLLTAGLFFCSHSAAADTIANELQVESNVARPDGKESVRVRDRLSIQDGDLTHSINTGYHQFFSSGNDTIQVVPLSYTIEERSGKVRLSGTVGIISADGEVYPNLRFSASVPLGNDVQISGEVAYSLFEESYETVNDGLTRLTISPHLQWQIDPDTRLITFYQVGFISDGNVQHRVNLQIEHQIGKDGLYVAPAVSYFGNEQEGDGYWDTRGQFALSSEVGWRFPLSDRLACQVGIVPRVSVDTDTEFRIGPGAGCEAKVGDRASLRVQGTAGYGVNLGVTFRTEL